METASLSVRTELLDRRQKLERAIHTYQHSDNLQVLLVEVDAALERVGDGSYGICESCHDAIEPELLRADPLIRFCLPHLTAEQQRALEQDLDLASHIQRELLPKQNFRHAGWEINYHYEPAGPVSGDHCDVIPQEADGLFFVLGDVSGKGIAASMLMGHLRAIFRTLVSGGLPVGRQVERANRIFCESTMSEHFATLVYGRASESGEIEITNAGHCPPLLLSGGKVTPLEATGLPLGMFCSGRYPSTSVRLAPGDMLLLYTDGLSEAADGSDIEYGVERLSRLAQNYCASGGQGLIDACLADLRTHLSGTPKSDDLTVMAIRRTA